MMFDPVFTIAVASLIGLIVVAAAALRGWRDWLEWKRCERDHAGGQETPVRDIGSPLGAARIELADLKERIRKLEAIASGVDL